jgi:hypothetical protein
MVHAQSPTSTAHALIQTTAIVEVCVEFINPVVVGIAIAED